MMLASAGIPVILAPEGAVSFASIELLADYFLTSPTLDVAIEPFFSYARFLGAGRSEASTLLELFGEVLGRHFYVDRSRRVTLSRRYAAAGLFFGSLEDGLAVWKTSDFWNHLASFEADIFVSRAKCAFCPHYRSCRGVFLRGPLASLDCAPWAHALNLVRLSFVATIQQLGVGGSPTIASVGERQ
jgi:hypothetical protein